MRLSALLLAFLCVFKATASPRYEVIGLGTLPGCNFSRGNDLNDQGQVVGWSETEQHVARAFVWDRGVMRELKIRNAREAMAVSLNNKGEISGSALIDGKRRTFVWLKDRTIDLGIIDDHPVLGLPGNFIAGGRINESSQVVFSLQDDQGEKRTAIWAAGVTSFPYAASEGVSTVGIAVNDRNEIAGQMFSWKPDVTSSVFLWRNGELENLGGLGGARASATRINNQGVVAGWALPKDHDLKQARAFVYQNQAMLDLGTLGGRASRAYGLSDQGVVVGYSYAEDGKPSAFIWSKSSGSMQDLNEMIAPSSGWRLTVAKAINRHGQILTQGFRDGQNRALLLNPTDYDFALRAPDENANPQLERSLSASVNRPLIASIQRLDDDGIRLILPTSTAPGFLQIEFSSDLRQWKPLGRPTLQGSQLHFLDPEAGRTPIRFYRVVRVSGSDS